MHGEARRLLDDLGAATNQLGDAFIEAGFPPSAWRAPDARLDALSGQLPNVTMDALLMRLATFATSTGPGWLVGGGAALGASGAFAREAQTLTRAVGPLRSLAERQRIKPTSARGPRPLERALGDGRVGTQLDRLAYTLRVLMELAPQLEREPTGPADISSAPAAPASKAAGKGTLGKLFPANVPRFEPQPEPAARVPFEYETYGPDDATSWLLGEAPALPPEAEPEARWPGLDLLQRVWPPRRPRIWALAGVMCLLVLGVSGVLARTLMPPGGSSSPTTAPLLRGGAAGTVVLTSPTPSQVAPTSTVVAAQLALSPTSITLPCSGASVTLKVSNTGGQALTWHASVAGNAVLSATSGSLDPQSSSAITVHAGSPQHGTGTITFTSDGGTVKVTFRVSCH